MCDTFFKVNVAWANFVTVNQRMKCDPISNNNKTDESKKNHPQEMVFVYEIVHYDFKRTSFDLSIYL